MYYSEWLNAVVSAAERARTAAENVDFQRRHLQALRLLLATRQANYEKAIAEQNLARAALTAAAGDRQ